MVGVWDKLLEEVVEAGTIAMFQKYLDMYIDRIGLERYGSNAGRWDLWR